MKKLVSIISFAILFSNAASSFTQSITVQASAIFCHHKPRNMSICEWFSYCNEYFNSCQVPQHLIKTLMAHIQHLFMYLRRIYNYNCTFHAGSGMSGSFTVVCPSISASISAASATTFCKPASVILNSTVTGSASTYQWKKGADNFRRYFTYSAKTTGTYKLLVTNACGVTATVKRNRCNGVTNNCKYNPFRNHK